VFAGFRRDVRRLLAASDVFVLPSLTEAMPMALLEAMAAGIPCVATRVGSVPEILGGGENGILVEPGDPHPLAQSLLTVFADPAGAASMAVRAKEKALSGFSATRMAQRYCDVYATLERGR
jgi:glycosyltransferase involved in cell wall biosynthesis